MDFDAYSDMYKSIYGRRPRTVPTQEQYDAFMASYDSRIDEILAEDKRRAEKAIQGCNRELGTEFTSIHEIDVALSECRDHRQYDIMLKWMIAS